MKLRYLQHPGDHQNGPSTKDSRYRGFEIPGVRDIGGSRYRRSRYRGFEIPEFEITGVRDTGGSKY